MLAAHVVALSSEHRSNASGRYLHSKGVKQDMRNPKWRKAVYLWRYIMEYHLIALWQDCVELLETYDAVGENPSHESIPGCRPRPRNYTTLMLRSVRCIVFEAVRCSLNQGHC